MPFRERSFWLAVGALWYVCFGSLPNAPRPFVPVVGLVALPLWLAEAWRRTRRAEIADRHLPRSAQSAARACHFGATLWIAARIGPAGHAALDAVANLGTAIAVMAALVSLARLPSEGGLLAPAPSTQSLDAVAFAGLLWGIAIALPATRALFPANVLLDPLTIDYATTTAGIGSLLVLIAAAFRLRFQRRLEMGVADRVSGALALSTTALSVAMPVALADVAPPDRVLPAGVIAGSLACAWTATTRESTTVSATLRGVLAIMILGVPTSLFAAVAARAFPSQAAPIALASAAAATVVGLVARDVAKPLGPEQSRWLDALERARLGALQPDPEAALRAALAALRSASRHPNARAELYRDAPEEVLFVDVADYLHVDKARVPEALYELALGEPERTLRVEALRALEVRRPEVRPLLAWFDARDAFCATVVVDEEGPIGFLLLPRGGRTRPLTLEEARALRLLSDRVSSLLAVSSALARSRERELAATERARLVESECTRLEGIISVSASRHRGAAELVARPVRVATYSPAARFAIGELEQHGKGGGPITLVVPPGVDAAGWAAIAHLANPSAGGPLVIVDGATGAAHDEARWKHPAESPLALADGGTLVVLDAPSLPEAIQDHIAREIGRRPPEGAAESAPPSSIPVTLLVATVRKPLHLLVGTGGLTHRLGARLEGGKTVLLPALANRPEDLRALVLDRLAGVGMRQHGEPLGIDPGALSTFLEHRWPGNDAELEDVLVRAAQVATGPVITRANLAEIGFRGESQPVVLPPVSVPPPDTRRRRSRPARPLR